MTDDQKGPGCGIAAGVLMILGGIVGSFGWVAMIAAGCGYAGVCQFLGIEYLLIPFAIGAVPVAGGVTLIILSVRRRGKDDTEPTNSGEQESP